MGWTKIFKTVIVKTNDGRILHFDRSGCNNDTEGRRRDEFTLKIYKDEKEFVNYANRFKENSAPYKKGGDFEMIICGRNASYYDYGEHLLRMLHRASSISGFYEKHPSFHGKYVVSIQITEPIREEISPEKFNVCDYLNKYGKVSYRINTNTFDSLEKILELIDENKVGVHRFNFFI